MTKTNAMRILDREGVIYSVHSYAGGALSGVQVAKVLGEDEDSVFKTLVTYSEQSLENYVFVIPVSCTLDLKKAAKVSGNKSAATVHVKDLLGLTGYIRGGCSPVGMKKPYPVFISSEALSLDYVYVSAGVRGLQMKLAPSDLIRATGASPAEII